MLANRARSSPLVALFSIESPTGPASPHTPSAPAGAMQPVALSFRLSLCTLCATAGQGSLAPTGGLPPRPSVYSPHPLPAATLGESAPGVRTGLHELQEFSQPCMPPPSSACSSNTVSSMGQPSKNASLSCAIASAAGPARRASPGPTVGITFGWQAAPLVCGPR